MPYVSTVPAVAVIAELLLVYSRVDPLTEVPLKTWQLVESQMS